MIPNSKYFQHKFIVQIVLFIYLFMLLFNNTFQGIMQYIDQRTFVDNAQLIKFPYNCIGVLKLVSKGTKFAEEKIGTGFLISNFLILTSASLFRGVYQNGNEGQYIPVSFTVTNWRNTKDEHKIIEHRRNQRYFLLSQTINTLISLFNAEKDSGNKNKLGGQIKTLSKERTKHNFALLKIGQRARRCQFFKLQPTIDGIQQLSVSGFSQFKDMDSALVTHSNKIAYIKDQTLYYDIDTGIGQSGSPVYAKQYENVVVAIHSVYDSQSILNSGTQITINVIVILQNWIKIMNWPFLNLRADVEFDKTMYQNQAGQEDRRKLIKQQNLNQFPYDCIGIIKGGCVFGTGFLISDSLVLTCAHTFYQIQQQGDNIPIKFSIFDLESPSAIKKQQYQQYQQQNCHRRILQIKQYRICQEYEKIQGQIKIKKQKRDSTGNMEKKRKLQPQILRLQQKQFQHDFALIKLPEKITRPNYFKLVIGFQLDIKQKQLVVTGYDNVGEYLLVTDKGKVDEIKHQAIYYNIFTKIGQSGSPVYYLNHKNKVVGIHTNGSNVQQKNLATMLTSKIVKILKRWSVQMTHLKVIRNK